MVEYNNFSQNTPYKIRPMATTISKPIDTKKITQRLRQQKTEEQHIGGTEELTLDNLNIQENTQEQSSLQAQIQIPPK
jgi:hypothetical protein